MGKKKICIRRGCGRKRMLVRGKRNHPLHDFCCFICWRASEGIETAGRDHASICDLVAQSNQEEVEDEEEESNVVLGYN